MIRCVLLVLCCAMLLGTSCPGGTTLICSNNLDVSDHGFTVVIPAEFECSLSFVNPAVTLANARYEQRSTGIKVSVQVNLPQEDDSSVDEADEVDTEITDLGDTTNDQGFTFSVQRVVVSRKGTGEILFDSYGAGNELASGNFLLITVASAPDGVTSQTLLDHLNAIIATVAAP